VEVQEVQHYLTIIILHNMTYTAPNGHIIVSSPDGPVTYTCPQTGMTEGTFFSLETASAPNSIGIQQIQITRVISEASITITIKESTSEELIAYQKEVDGGASDAEIIQNLFNN
jgi:hypothetical protein